MAQLAHITFCEPNTEEEWQSSPGQNPKSPRPLAQGRLSLKFSSTHASRTQNKPQAPRLSRSQETFPSPPIEQRSHLQLPDLKAGQMTAEHQLETCPNARLSLTFTTLLCLLQGRRATLQPFPHIRLLENIPEDEAAFAALPPSVSWGALPTASLPHQHGTSTTSSRTSASTACFQKTLLRTGVLPL